MEQEMIKRDEFEILACTGGGWDPSSVLEFFDHYYPRRVQENKNFFFLCVVCHGYHFQAIPDFEWRV